MYQIIAIMRHISIDTHLSFRSSKAFLVIQALTLSAHTSMVKSTFLKCKVGRASSILSPIPRKSDRTELGWIESPLGPHLLRDDLLNGSAKMPGETKRRAKVFRRIKFSETRGNVVIRHQTGTQGG